MKRSLLLFVLNAQFLVIHAMQEKPTNIESILDCALEKAYDEMRTTAMIKLLPQRLANLCADQNEQRHRTYAEILSIALISAQKKNCVKALLDTEIDLILDPNDPLLDVGDHDNHVKVQLPVVVMLARNALCLRVLLQYGLDTAIHCQDCLYSFFKQRLDSTKKYHIEFFKFFHDYNNVDIHQCPTSLIDSYKDYFLTIFKDKTSYLSRIPMDLRKELLNISLFSVRS